MLRGGRRGLLRRGKGEEGFGGGISQSFLGMRSWIIYFCIDGDVH
jgi:hypothetical protein